MNKNIIYISLRTFLLYVKIIVYYFFFIFIWKWIRSENVELFELSVKEYLDKKKIKFIENFVL